MKFTPLDQKILEIKKNFEKEFYDKLLNIVAEFEMNEKKYKFNKALLKYINSLKNQKFAIYSMNTKRCVDYIISKYFKRKPDIIIYKENCIEPKPSSKDLNKILNLWNYNNTDVVFVGNSKKDKQSGACAKIRNLIIEI